MYARIRLDEGFLNIFTTHTQATYVEATVEDLIPSYVCRLKQLITAKNYIYKTLDTFASQTDLNLFMGDLNVDAVSKSYPIDRVISYFQDDLHSLSDFQLKRSNEYDLLMYIFNHSQNNYLLTDMLYEDHKVSKITYGDCHYRDEESLVPSVG